MPNSRSRSALASYPKVGTQCMGCLHQRGMVQVGPDSADGLEATMAPACAAFPKGIPDDITLNRFDHRQPWDAPPGDNGIRWTPLVEGLEFPTLDPVD